MLGTLGARSMVQGDEDWSGVVKREILADGDAFVERENREQDGVVLRGRGGDYDLPGGYVGFLGSSGVGASREGMFSEKPGWDYSTRGSAIRHYGDEYNMMESKLDEREGWGMELMRSDDPETERCRYASSWSRDHVSYRRVQEVGVSRKRNRESGVLDVSDESPPASEALSMQPYHVAAGSGHSVCHRPDAELDLESGSRQRVAHEGFGDPGLCPGAERNATTHSKPTEKGKRSFQSKGCSFKGCSNVAVFGAKSSRVGVLCRQHAKSGMVFIASKRCLRDGCNRRPCFGWQGSTFGVYCTQHAEKGMVLMSKKWCARNSGSSKPCRGAENARIALADTESGRCINVGCSRRSCFGWQGSDVPMFCTEHADMEMVLITGRLCARHGCSSQGRSHAEGMGVDLYCEEHAMDGVVKDNASGSCAHEGCSLPASYGVEGKETDGLYCEKHAGVGMVKVKAGSCCAHEGCGREASYGMEGKETDDLYCKNHAVKGMVNLKAGRCAHDGCSKQPTYSAEGSKLGVYCREHA